METQTLNIDRKSAALHFHRGGILISALVFTVIVALCLAGIGTLCVSHYSRASVDGNFASALNLAEAGVNYEFRKVSVNPTSADQDGGASPSGVTYALGGDTFRVYCTNKDNSVPWTPPNDLYVISTGVVNGVSRTVKVSAKGYAGPGNFAIYSMNSTSTFHGSAMSITGDVGTNSLLSFSGSPGISGSIYFDGPNAGWSGGVGGAGYTTVLQPQPIAFATVDQKANTMFPAGGLAWLATHNDNALASPPIIGNTISGSESLPGPGNYYVTSMSMNGQRAITFANSAGPVNLWVGPSGGAGSVQMHGGSAAVAMSSNPANACHIYVATKGGIDLAGNQTMDAGLYAYNKDASGVEYGSVRLSGTPTINGQVLASTVDLNGNITINYVPGLIQATSFGYYGFDNSWQDLSTSVYN